jgi:Myb-like DNA-binding domain
VLKPGLVKGQWNKEEDARLLQLVEQRCYKNWGCLAQHMDGRTSKQVSHHYLVDNIPAATASLSSLSTQRAAA